MEGRTAYLGRAAAAGVTVPVVGVHPAATGRAEPVGGLGQRHSVGRYTGEEPHRRPELPAARRCTNKISTQVKAIHTPGRNNSKFPVHD